MAYWILPASGIPIFCTTVQRITNLEKNQTVWKNKREAYEMKVNVNLSATSSSVDIPHDLIKGGKLLSLDYEDEEFICEFNRVIDCNSVKHGDDLKIGDDNFIGTELGI